MALFSNEVAGSLQYVTFPLELVGLTLAMIEVRFPALAARIASYISTELTRARARRNKENQQTKKYISRATDNLPGQLVLSGAMSVSVGSPFPALKPVFATIAALTFLGILAHALAYLLFSAGLLELAALETVLNWLFCLLSTAFVILAFLIACSVFLVIADRWVIGRAVGTLGIIIAGLGVLGEAYQFLTQLIA